MIRADLRYAARTLRLNPIFSVTAILALALGIGATTAIFSVVDAVLLRPLPYAHADRLVNVSAWLQFDAVVSAEYFEWAETNRVFESYGAMWASTDRAPLTAGDEAVLIWSKHVTPNLLSTLEVAPLIGHSFEPGDFNPNGRSPILISYGLWQRYFGGDRGLIGRPIVFDGKAREVVGVLPRNFVFPAGVPVDALVPIQVDIPRVRARQTMGMWNTIGRLKPGVSIGEARAEMETLFAHAAAAHRDMYRRDVKMRVMPLQEWLTGNARLTLLVLLAGVCCVLLIACANVANLLLARATERRREIAIRSALGAGRMRLVRQLLTENLLLAVLGGSVGIALAAGAVELLGRAGSQDVPRLSEVTVDLRVMAFAAFVSVATGMVFGLAPALSATRPIARFARSGPRAFLVAAELALSVVLLIASSLMFQSLWRLQHKRVGFVPDQLLSAAISARGSRAVALRDRVAAVPGLQSMAFCDSLPPSSGSSFINFSRQDRPLPEPGHRGDTMVVRHVSPSYFSTLRIPLLRGRIFDDHDAPDETAVINQALARAYFPGEDPLGKRIDLLPRGSRGRVVVGIVGDVKNQGLNREADPEMYRPMNGSERSVFVVVRALADPAMVLPALRRELRAADPQNIATLRSMDQTFGEMTARPRFQGVLFGSFAALALLLAAIGIYGMVAFAVTRRAHEIGIRIALGADGGRVTRMVVGEMMIPVAAGIAIGLAGAFAAGRFVEQLLYDVKPHDAPTYAVVAGFLALVAVTATIGPARRAARVNPIEVLRAE